MTPFQLYNKQQWDAPQDNGSPVTRQRIWDNIIRTLSLRNTRRVIIIGFASASVAAACLAAGIFIGRSGEMAPQTITTTETQWMACGPEARILPDGSKIWLSSGSSIKFADSFAASRIVSLSGNATFEVIHQENETPFTVEMSDESSIIVRGTTFSVTQRPGEQISVSLYDGKVDFVTPAGKTSMNPGETLTFLPAAETVSVEATSSAANWQNGRFKLDNMPLAEIVDFIRWRYGVEVYVSPRVLKENKKLTGSIGHDESVESVVDKICYVMGLSYRREESGYRISSNR